MPWVNRCQRTQNFKQLSCIFNVFSACNASIVSWKNLLVVGFTRLFSSSVFNLFLRRIFISNSSGLGSPSLCRCLWMLSCDQIPHWDADEGPTCFKLRSWLWRQPPGLFVLPAVISAHHPKQRLTGSPPPPFHKQLHSHFTSQWPYCGVWTCVEPRSVEVHNGTVLVHNLSDTTNESTEI